MYKILVILMIFFIVSPAKSQTCGDAIDSLTSGLHSKSEPVDFDIASVYLDSKREHFGLKPIASDTIRLKEIQELDGDHNYNIFFFKLITICLNHLQFDLHDTIKELYKQSLK